DPWDRDDQTVRSRFPSKTPPNRSPLKNLRFACLQAKYDLLKRDSPALRGRAIAYDCFMQPFGLSSRTASEASRSGTQVSRHRKSSRGRGSWVPALAPDGARPG